MHPKSHDVATSSPVAKPLALRSNEKLLDGKVHHLQATVYDIDEITAEVKNSAIQLRDEIMLYRIFIMCGDGHDVGSK